MVRLFFLLLRGYATSVNPSTARHDIEIPATLRYTCAIGNTLCCSFRISLQTKPNLNTPILSPFETLTDSLRI